MKRTLETTTYLVLEKRGALRCNVVAARQSKPTRRGNQIAVKLRLNLPGDIFENFADCSVNVSIDEVLKPDVRAAIEHVSEDGLDELANLISKRKKQLKKDKKKAAVKS